MSKFDYLIEKIAKAEFQTEPFKHLYIENFFDEEDFKKITASSEISLGACQSDDDLFSRLFENNYKVISFPGCTTDYKEYIKKHSRGMSLKSHTACESAGVVVRLYPEDRFLAGINKFFQSDKFSRAVAEKFEINLDSCTVDGGIQKYLDGYEISPHPDVRKKAATFMVNINPHAGSESLNHHTHYLKLKSEYTYIREFWEQTPKAERQWVPWEWCETEFLQTKNNSVVLFSPANDTMHGVKAQYDHLQTQRTQTYGNLWYRETNTTYAPCWERLENRNFSEIPGKTNGLKKRVEAFGNLAKKVAGAIKKSDRNIGDRNF